MNFHEKSGVSKESFVSDIPKSVRTVCILHLCIAFSVLFWILCAPFTEALYYNKKALNDLDWLTNEHKPLFESLSQRDQDQISTYQKQISFRMSEPFQQKLAKSIETFFLGMPISKTLWLALSLLLPVLVMKQVEGAKESFWILPVLVAVYAWQITPLDSTVSIYPTESYLEKKYLSGPLRGTIEDQRDLLETAWKKYIIHEWSQAPKEAGEGEMFANGMYHFIAKKTLREMNQPAPKPGPWTLAAYFIWNLMAATCIYFVREPTRTTPLKALS